MTQHAIGVDVGGTKIEVIRIDADGSILARDREPTPSDEEGSLDVAMDLADRVRSEDVVGIGIGAAGMIDVQRGVLRYGPNLAWRELGVVERFDERFDVPSLLDNDGNAAAWGEFRFGAGVGSTDMLAVTVGTGIGGGIVHEGRIYHGAHGFAGEIGHIIVDPAGPRCGCGNVGCWEQVASGSAITRNAREAVIAHPDSRFASLVGHDPDALTGTQVTEAAQQGDEIAIGILAEAGRRLGEGIAGLVNVLDVDRVVVGGGVISAGDLLLEPTRRAYRDAVESMQHRPEVTIVAATLGNDAGAVGAAALALEAFAVA